MVSPGRPFIRRLINQTLSYKSPFSQIKLRAGTREDIKTWITFLDDYNGVSLIPNLTFSNSNILNLYTDASGVGYGGTYGSSWICGPWPTCWRKYNTVIFESTRYLPHLVPLLLN